MVKLFLTFLAGASVAEASDMAEFVPPLPASQDEEVMAAFMPRPPPDAMAGFRPPPPPSDADSEAEEAMAGFIPPPPVPPPPSDSHGAMLAATFAPSEHPPSASAMASAPAGAPAMPPPGPALQVAKILTPLLNRIDRIDGLIEGAVKEVEQFPQENMKLMQAEEKYVAGILDKHRESQEMYIGNVQKELTNHVSKLDSELHLSQQALSAKKQVECEVAGLQKDASRVVNGIVVGMNRKIGENPEFQAKMHGLGLAKTKFEDLPKQFLYDFQTAKDPEKKKLAVLNAFENGKNLMTNVVGALLPPKRL